MNHIIDIVRKDVVEQLFAANTFNQAFNTWKPKIQTIIGIKPTANSILSIAHHMRDIFKSTGGDGRDQGSLSGGGAAWESLVCYYLNLCLIGTNSVVIKKNSMIPLIIRHAMTVTYGNVPANTESDLICLTAPDDELLDIEKNPLQRGETVLKRFEGLIDKHFNNVQVSVIQCKTNWNDNAQIPMLWDMIYNVDEFEDENRIRVGIHNRYLNKANFNYAFMTVPSNKLESFKPNSLPIKRVAALSGGNYWGCDSKPGIAQSLREIFGKAKIGPNKGKDVLHSLSSACSNLHSDYDYFQL